MLDHTMPATAFDVGRIAILSHTHPSISKGGAEIASYTLYEGLRAIGVDAVFVAACAEQDRHRLRLGSEHERVVTYDPVMYDNFYHISAPPVLAQLRRILGVDQPYLVNFHHFLNFGLNALRGLAGDGARLVVTLHEFLAICHHHGQMVTHPARHLCEAASANACGACFPERSPEQFQNRQRFALDGLGRATGFVSPSRFLADRFARWGLERGRIAVIENGLRSLPPRAEAPAALSATATNLRPGRQRRMAPSSPPADRHWTFGFFGQINPFKGVDVLLRAAALIERSPDLTQRVQIRIHGNVIGQSPEFVARFEAAVASHACLEYAGPYENTSVGRLMQACDYVLIPSTWWENSPVVIQEAFIVGRPVLCSGVGGMAEKVVDSVSGLHFRMGDPSDLVQAMRRAADSDMHARLSAGLPPVLDAAGMAQEYLKAYRRFLAAASAPA